MRTRNMLAGAALALLVFAFAVPSARAGGSLETFDLTNPIPTAEDPNLMLTPVVPMFNDSRCIPVPFTLNTRFDKLPNPLGAPFVSIEDARLAVQAAMATWTEIPTSFIAMTLTAADTKKPTPSGFDFINEVEFLNDADAPAGLLGVSPGTAIMRRTVFNAGDDLDGDGDSDVAANITTCGDVDGDGDIEFPVGTYEAGTIIDNDILFNTGGVRFTTADGAVDTEPGSVDLMSIATHELGHSLGLSHSIVNQRSGADGAAATMFPFVNTAEPAAELTQRLPDPEAISIATDKYPEGSAQTGPGAIQPGDVRPARRFGTVTGTVVGPDNVPVLGASVFCRNRATGAIASSSYSGQLQFGMDPAGDLFILSPESFMSGNFKLLVPPGTHDCGIEAVDGSPASADQLNTTTNVGGLIGQQAFPEEFFNGAAESAFETNPGAATPVVVRVGRTNANVRFVTEADVRIEASSERTEALQDAVRGNADLIAAVVVPGFTLLETEKNLKAMLGPDTTLAISRAEFRSLLVDSSTVPLFASASVNRCSSSVTPDGFLVLDVDMASPLRSFTNFVGQDDDSAPLFLTDSVGLGTEVFTGLRAGTFNSVCLLLRYRSGPFPGPSAVPPLLAIDGVLQNPAGLSFASTDGGQSFFRVGLNLQFSLGLTPMNTTAQQQQPQTPPADPNPPQRRGRPRGRR